jgi:hypothetical protein
MGSGNDLFWQLLFNSLIATVLVFASIGLAIGVGLLVSSGRTVRFIQSMNRWVSTRGVLKAMEIPRDTEQVSHRNGRRIGWALMAGGSFAALGLIFGVDTAAFSAAVAKGDARVMVAIVAATLKWFLFLGSLAGVLVGYLLCFSPHALATLEKYANRWFSPRQAKRGGDDVHLTLDRLVEAHPMPSGWILACTGLGAVAYAVALLLARA